MPSTRRAVDGVHYTPAPLAREIVRQGIAALGQEPRTVADPACGAGALLVAAADELLAAGVAPEEIVGHRLVGVELDPDAAAVAADALRGWCADAGGDPDRVTPRISALDAFDVAVERWPHRPSSGLDLVVANPPFLDQLDRASARDADRRHALAARFGRVGPYCDTAALFLLLALELVRDGGVVSILQPQSFLAARDTAAVRDRALRDADLVALWAGEHQPFEASVHVCAPVLRRRSSPPANGASVSDGVADTVQVRVTTESRTAGRPVRRDDLVALSVSDRTASAPSDRRAPTDVGSWAGLLAPAACVPVAPVVAAGRPRLSSLASATAGFRDEFYALVAALVDPDDMTGIARDRSAPLVSVAMIDPATSYWGSTAARIGGELRVRPCVDLDRLEVDAPRVGRWATARLRPKVLVASQGRVVEAVADERGAAVVLTPVIAVEPHDADDLWRVLAALLAPTVSARLVAQRLGTGRSTRSVRWSASALADIELPADEGAWAHGARLAEQAQRSPRAERLTLLAELARVMCASHLVDPDGPDGVELVSWWVGRVAERLERGGVPDEVDDLLR